MNNLLLLTAKSDLLLVDDNRENLRLLSAMLNDYGYKVRKALSGSLALRAVEIKQPDLILLDINMPHMNGYQVCEKLKSHRQTANIPVIFLSALYEVLYKVKAFEVGGVDYITKPFELQEVLVRVRNQLMISLQQKQLRQQQKQLIEQNSQLQLLLTTTAAIRESADFDAALEATLSQVCEKIGWDFGEFWLPNAQATVFESGKGWYTRDHRFEEFRRKSKTIIFANHKDLLRQICLSRQPCWVADVSVEACDVFQRNQLAQEVGLKACLGVPILFNKQILVVLLLLKQEASVPEPPLIKLVNYLATQLSSFIGHKRSESALQESQQQLAAMAANIPGCVYRGVVHTDGRMKLLYISEGEHELSGLKPQEAMAEPKRLLETISSNNQAHFYEAVRVLAQSLKPSTQHYPMSSPNGEIKWVRNSARYSLMENGDVMVDGVAIDISDCLENSFASHLTMTERLRFLEQAIACSHSLKPNAAFNNSSPLRESP